MYRPQKLRPTEIKEGITSLCRYNKKKPYLSQATKSMQKKDSDLESLS